MGAERRTAMASFLCLELLDFASTERRHGGRTPLPSCGPVACPGLGHLPDLAGAAAPATGDSAEALLRRFGTALFGTLLRRYPSFFVGITSTRELLASFEGHLVAEIGKLAPHLILPAVTVEPLSGTAVAFACRFPDGRDDVAPLVEGLVLGSTRHFGEPCTVTWHRGTERGAASFVIAPRARAAGGRGA